MKKIAIFKPAVKITSGLARSYNQCPRSGSAQNVVLDVFILDRILLFPSNSREMIYTRQYNRNCFSYNFLQERLRYGHGTGVILRYLGTYRIESMSGCGSGSYGTYITEGRSKGWFESVPKDPYGAYSFAMLKPDLSVEIAVYFEKINWNTIKNALRIFSYKEY